AVSRPASVWDLEFGIWVLGFAKESQSADKPNSVRRRALRRVDVTIIPLGPRLLADSCDLPGGLGRAVLIAPPYLVLLRAGFCLPPALPSARCALTAPFHPYPSTHRFRGSLRAVSFLCHWSVKLPCPGVTRRTALWSSDFPPADALSRPGNKLFSLPLRHEARRRAIVWPTATPDYRVR